MKAIVESHGGTVAKFIGDAVMAVFGVPVLHEDDALRAARAAVEMRDAFPELGVEGRIGVMTEVVTGTAASNAWIVGGTATSPLDDSRSIATELDICWAAIETLTPA